MIWHDHSRDPHLGEHAILSPSHYPWVNYDDDKLIAMAEAIEAKEIGTRLHAFACEAIRLGQRLPKSRKTLNQYVNDAIGFKMEPEMEVYYSKYCYGKADAISFKNKLLRVHDLKTGVTPAKLTQLETYAALFCLDYSIDPYDIEFELRIYQNDDVLIGNPDPDYIRERIKTIVHDSEILRKHYEGEAR